MATLKQLLAAIGVLSGKTRTAVSRSMQAPRTPRTHWSRAGVVAALEVDGVEFPSWSEGGEANAPGIDMTYAPLAAAPPAGLRSAEEDALTSVKIRALTAKLFASEPRASTAFSQLMLAWTLFVGEDMYESRCNVSDPFQVSFAPRLRVSLTELRGHLAGSGACVRPPSRRALRGSRTPPPIRPALARQQRQ